MSKLFMLWHRPAICAYLFFETRRRLLSKKELPEGIYNYETTGSGIQIIIELKSGLFDSVHNLNV